MDWQPGTSLQALQARARLLSIIRAFFAARNVLEVETPLLCSRGVTDPAIEPLEVRSGVSIEQTRYLQTSPEYAMKRLLAAGSGAIYQLARAFRDGEAGGRHNPEFALLEWYQPGYDHHQMMREVADLVSECLGERHFSHLSYRELFGRFLGIDPFVASVDQLEAEARRTLDVSFTSGDRDDWLDLLMSHIIEPQLATVGACFVYDYPASQAALSQITSSGGVQVGQRFELYVDGMELANGYFELTDPAEQRARFMADNQRRESRGQTPRPVDERLLAAMEGGLPSCSGVALGVDRLLMLSTGAADIRDVMAFDWQRC